MDSKVDLSMDGFAATGAGAPAPTATPQSRPRKSGAPKPRPAQQPEKPKRQAPDSVVRTNPVIAFFTARRTRYVLGLLLVAWSVCALIVTFSYLKDGVRDQSIVATQTIAQAAASGEALANPGGAAGARMAHIMLVDGFGIASLGLVFYAAMLGLALFGQVKIKFWSFTFKCLFTTIALSIILGLVTYDAESVIHWGGNHGHYVNAWLFQMSDWLGAVAVSVVLAGLLVIMYIVQLTAFIRAVSGRVNRARASMAAAAAAGRKTSTVLADLPDTPVKDPEDPGDSKDLNGRAPAEITEPAPAPFGGFSIDDDEPSENSENSENSEYSEISEASESSESSEPSEPTFTIKTAASLSDSAEAAAEATAPADQPEPLDPDDPLANPQHLEPMDIRDELSHFRFPGLDLLEDRPVTAVVNEEEQEENKNMIVNTLRDYGVPISRIEATVGPTVTLYEVVPAEGVRIAQIKRLEDDIALQLAALGIRIIAPIPGKGTVGIEVPNRDPQTVSMFSIINSKKFRECKMALPMALGSTINNDVFIADLTKMPHLLVAGATGQGKSVGLNCIIASLLYKKHPAELKFVLIDPKMVEFSLYSRIEHHYLAKLPDEEDPIVTEPSKALTTLQSICIEMDNRYELLKSACVRTVEEYNKKYTRRLLNPQKGHRYMPYIVVVVDEFADLIMTAGKDISVHIARIAQKARAVGIHMIIATQRPSTDIITGMIKANFPGRIAFRVASMVDSRTILDSPGANRLIGRGDMLFSHNSKMERVQCAFIDTPEVEAICDFIDRQTGYPTAYLLPEVENENALTPGAIDLSKRDELFDDCARFVVQNSTASTSSLQRRFGIGYNKAGKIMDQLEAAGIVGPADGQRPRSVLVDSMAVEDLLRTL